MKVEEKSVRSKTGEEFLLRGPRPDEAQLMIDHMRITVAESYRNLNQTVGFWDAMKVEDERRILSEVAAAKDRFLICAFAGERIVSGLSFVGASGEFLKHSGRLGMSVQKAYGGIGLGEHLLRHALECARRLGFYRVELTVRAFNAPAIALYEKLGFGRVGRLTHVARIDGQYFDEFMYELMLD